MSRGLAVHQLDLLRQGQSFESPFARMQLGSVGRARTMTQAVARGGRYDTRVAQLVRKAHFHVNIVRLLAVS